VTISDNESIQMELHSFSSENLENISNLSVMDIDPPLYDF